MRLLGVGDSLRGPCCPSGAVSCWGSGMDGSCIASNAMAVASNNNSY